jgi:hypothetical protein
MPSPDSPSTRHSAQSASRPGASVPSSRSRPRQAAADAAHARRQQRLVQLVDHASGLVGGRAVDPEADRDAGVEQLPGRRGARAEAAVGGRAVGDAGRGRREAINRLGTEVNAVRHPHVLPEPAELLDVLRRGAAEPLAAELLLVAGLGEMGVQAHAA